MLGLQPGDRPRRRPRRLPRTAWSSATRALIVGDPLDPATDIGPVIDAGGRTKIRHYIDIGKPEGKLELACDVPPGLAQRVGKPYVAPHIFSDIRAAPPPRPGGDLRPGARP